MNDSLFDAPEFEATPAAALARLAAVRPDAYARTRNHLDGAVTRLSPYITHGLLTLPQVHAAVSARHALAPDHKLVFELAWREYFRHVWWHDGEGILESLHEGPLPDSAYVRQLPADLIRGETGVPVIDRAVRQLVDTGWLHNHARMWLASYVVHVRHLHWRAGADWMFGHLLDGDLASNHLSWQWVAGTGSHKPYLFNAENVARYAPSDWHSPGTVIDTSYESLERMARSARAPRAAGAAGAASDPASGLLAHPGSGFTAPSAETVRGRDVWVIHPWALADPPADGPPDALRVAVADADWHARWPWSAARWRFVTARMRALCSRPGDALWWGSRRELVAALQAARSVRGVDDPHLGGWLDSFDLDPQPLLFEWPQRRCGSFSQFWNRARLRASG